MQDTTAAPEKISTRLAIEGGTPLRSTPFAPWPWFEPDEMEAVAAVLRSGKVNYWTGEEGRQFEREFAAYTGVQHAVALANGSVALELALYALGIGAGDEVVATSRSFVASASCIALRGAKPVFADIDRDSQNVTADTIARVLTPRTKAVIAVHLGGWPCDMDPILELARSRKLYVIEDCAQAHGARYKGRPVGSMGDINAFSFCQDKIMTTGGEGGMITTNRADLWKPAWSYKDHGKSYEAVYHRLHPPGYRWLHESVGTNWRLTEMQSALGRVLLGKLDERVKKRRRFAQILTDAFLDTPGLRTPMPDDHSYHSYYKYYAFVRPERLRTGWDRDRIVGAINAEGIPSVAAGWPEIYLEKAFEGMRPAERLPVAKELGETSVMFQVHTTLSQPDLHDTISAVRKVMMAASE